MWIESPEMVVFLAMGLAGCEVTALLGRAFALATGRASVLALRCVVGVALMLLAQSHLQVVDVFAQVSGNFAVDDTLELQARNLV